MDENDGKSDTLTAALYITIFITCGYYKYIIIKYPHVMKIVIYSAAVKVSDLPSFSSIFPVP